MKNNVKMLENHTLINIESLKPWKRHQEKKLMSKKCENPGVSVKNHRHVTIKCRDSAHKKCSLY